MRAASKTSIFFRIYGSPDGTNIVTVSLGEANAQPGRGGNGRKRQDAAVVVCVSPAGCLLMRIDKLRCRRCQFSCSCSPFRAVVQRQLPCYECDTFEMFCDRSVMF